MIFTRIKRGAERTNLLLRNKIATYRLPALRKPRYGQAARTLGLSALAAYTATMPVAQLHAAAALAGPEGSGEPPSTSGILAVELPDLRFDPTSTESIQFDTPNLGQVAVGESAAAAQAEELARQQAAEQQAEAAAQALQAEQERQRQLAAQRRQAELAALARQQLPTPAPAPAAPAEPAPPAVPQSAPGDIRSQVHAAAASAFGEDQVVFLFNIIERESGFNPQSYNRSSGACGLFQALPCSKMGGMDVANQIRWGIGYIRARYGTPSNAWAFWSSHHWY